MGPAAVEVYPATYVSPSSGLCLAVRDSLSGLCKPGLTDSYTLALAACDTVNAFAMGFALLASAALSPVLTDTGASALLALAALSVVLARLRRHRVLLTSKIPRTIPYVPSYHTYHT